MLRLFTKSKSNPILNARGVLIREEEDPYIYIVNGWMIIFNMELWLAAILKITKKED